MTIPSEIPEAKKSQELEELIQLRREFHRYPEIGWTEFYTTARICDLLDDLGFELTLGKQLYEEIRETTAFREVRMSNVPKESLLNEAYNEARARLGSGSMKWLEDTIGGYTGLIAHMRCGKGGPRVGFRFDIDSLPIIESMEQNHIPYREGFASTNENMHACGHDGHIAMGLGLAKRISLHRHSLNGDLYLIFQPAEEGRLGGKVFSKLNVVENLDYFVGFHIGLMQGRKIACGLLFMDATKFNVIFKGESAHAAIAPNEGRNALFAACDAVIKLYAIPRHRDGTSRVNVGEFFANNAVNVISDRASFQVEVRGENPDICSFMENEAKRILKAAAEMHNVEIEVHEGGRYISAPNSVEMKEMVRNIAQRIGIPDQAILDEFLIYGSEDAPYLMRAVQENDGKAIYFGLGSNITGNHHSSHFDFEEDMLKWGVDLLWELAKELSS